MRILLFLILFLELSVVSCHQENTDPFDPPLYNDYRTFISFADFNFVLDNLSLISDSAQRETRISRLFDSLTINKQIPFILNDSVAFLYNGAATSVSWSGDFNGWNSQSTDYQGTKLGLSTIFRVTKTFPHDARLDYKIVLNGNSWILDQLNSYQQYSGFGPNSELRMPGWINPQETVPGDAVLKGVISENIRIVSRSENLNYSVQYKVYTPYNYQESSNLSVIYVTDGHEYADDRLGAMKTVLDNLIFQNQIPPVIAVFIDPRNPDNLGQNRRMTEYTGNIRYARFLAEELAPCIDTTYRTNPSPNHRAILGTSLGGWNSAYVGYHFSGTFGLIGIHSPAFDAQIIQDYSNSPRLPLKIYMSTGVIFDTQNQARAMHAVFGQLQYPFLYKEVNEGHSWGNWRALIDEPLIFFFGQ